MNAPPLDSPIHPSGRIDADHIDQPLDILRPLVESSILVPTAQIDDAIIGSATVEPFGSDQRALRINILLLEQEPKLARVGLFLDFQLAERQTRSVEQTAIVLTVPLPVIQVARLVVVSRVSDQLIFVPAQSILVQVHHIEPVPV